MTDRSPRDYDREYTERLSPQTRVRLGYAHVRGEVTRFVVQLEYTDGEQWHQVVRYDHDAKGHAGASHDVTEEGLHIDIYREGAKYRTEYLSPPMPASEALDRAEDHLMQNLESFIKRFETWHRITDR